MAETALLVGFSGVILVCLLELLLDDGEQEPPRWLDYVDGPYIRKGITLKGRDW